MLLLCFFDRIRGPIVFMTSPGSLVQELSEEYQDQIKSLLDSDDEGFSTHSFSPELKVAYHIFSIDSSWARGRTELVMIAVIVQEEEPDYNSYEKLLSKFVSNIKSNVKAFMAFYINATIEAASEQKREEILSQYEFLETQLDNLYKILAIKRIETEGQLISLMRLKETKSITITKDILNKISRISDGKQNCFLVFRSRGNAMKLDIIPVDSERIYRLAIIFGQQVSVNMIQLFSKTFSYYDQKMKLIFTSGLCQETDKCIYEVYIDTDQITLNETIQELYELPGIIQIEIELLETNK